MNNNLSSYPIFPFVFVENSFTGLKQTAIPGINKAQFFILIMMLFNKVYKDLDINVQINNTKLLEELNKNKIYQEEPAFPLVYFENDKQIVLPGLTYEDLQFICQFLDITLDISLLSEYAYPIKNIIT